MLYELITYPDFGLGPGNLHIVRRGTQLYFAAYDVARMVGAKQPTNYIRLKFAEKMELPKVYAEDMGRKVGTVYMLTAQQFFQTVFRHTGEFRDVVQQWVIKDFLAQFVTIQKQVKNGTSPLVDLRKRMVASPKEPDYKRRKNEPENS